MKTIAMLMSVITLGIVNVFGQSKEHKPVPKAVPSDGPAFGSKEWYALNIAKMEAREKELEKLVAVLPPEPDTRQDEVNALIAGRAFERAAEHPLRAELTGIRAVLPAWRDFAAGTVRKPVSLAEETEKHVNAQVLTVLKSHGLSYPRIGSVLMLLADTRQSATWAKQRSPDAPVDTKHAHEVLGRLIPGATPSEISWLLSLTEEQTKAVPTVVR